MKNILNRKTEDLEHDSPGVSWRCLAFFLSGDCFIILCMLICLSFYQKRRRLLSPVSPSVFSPTIWFYPYVGSMFGIMFIHFHQNRSPSQCAEASAARRLAASARHRKFQIRVSKTHFTITCPTSLRLHTAAERQESATMGITADSLQLTQYSRNFTDSDSLLDSGEMQSVIHVHPSRSTDMHPLPYADCDNAVFQDDDDLKIDGTVDEASPAVEGEEQYCELLTIFSHHLNHIIPFPTLIRKLLFLSKRRTSR